MALPISPPYPPMEALLVDTIPVGKEWQYEPKWDGFRCLAFKDGKNVELQSKSGQSLGRYFPELISALQQIKAKKFVLDGEIVIPVQESFSFDDLLQRIHPAESRIRKLSQEYPANILAFDLLVSAEGKLLVGQPLKERRRLLEIFLARYLEHRFNRSTLTGHSPNQLGPYLARDGRRQTGWPCREAFGSDLPIRRTNRNSKG